MRLYTFGTLRLEQAGKAVAGPAGQRRRLALLALLAAAGERGLSREKLFGYLWPEHDTARARHLLSESLYVIRRVAGDDVFLASGDDVRLNADMIWSDVGEFRRARDLALYRGPFLDGFFLPESAEFDQWAATERDSLAREYARELEARARAAEPGAAIDCWRQLALHDPHSARIAIAYMQALADAGDRAAAIRHGSAFAKRLRDDLGVDADADVIAFQQKLQRSAPSPAPATTGDPLEELAGEFEIQRLIGEGAVARVYLARELALKRSVAIKVLRVEHASVERARLRFEREAQTAGRIQHPNVATPFQFGRLTSGVPYIVLPYIGGGSLADRLHASGRIPLGEARKQIAQLASALAAAHRLGIVHRDVRPANILYDRDSERVLLTDFGLAAVADAAAAEGMRLTLPGEALGNVAYASPEQLRGEKVTDRADVYSLGITAFEMLTGELPFAARTGADMMIAHAAEEPRRVRDVLQDVPKELDDLLRRCLNKRPEQRPFAEELS